MRRLCLRVGNPQGGDKDNSTKSFEWLVLPWRPPCFYLAPPFLPTLMRPHVPDVSCKSAVSVVDASSGSAPSIASLTSAPTDGAGGAVVTVVGGGSGISSSNVVSMALMPAPANISFAGVSSAYKAR